MIVDNKGRTIKISKGNLINEDGEPVFGNINFNDVTIYCPEARSTGKWKEDSFEMEINLKSYRANDFLTTHKINDYEVIKL